MSKQKSKKIDYSHRSKGKSKGKSKEPLKDKQVSPLGVQLAKVLTYKREPDLFDTDLIKERDRLIQIEQLKTKDKERKLERKGKPVVTTPLQNRFLYNCQFFLGLQLEKEDMQAVINNPIGAKPVFRWIDLREFSKTMFGRYKNKYVEDLRKLIKDLNEIDQLQIMDITLDGKKKKIEVIEPLLYRGRQVREKSTKEDSLNFIQVGFGRAFFVEMNEHFGIQGTKTLEQLRKGKKGELFYSLYGSIQAVFWQFYSAMNKTKGELETENSKLPEEERLSPEELEKKVREAMEEVSIYQLSFTSIKEGVTTDYDSTKQNKYRFKADLNKAIKELIETKIITNKSRIARGKKEEKALLFINYYYLEELTKEGESSPIGTNPLLLE